MKKRRLIAAFLRLANAVAYQATSAVHQGFGSACQWMLDSLSVDKAA
jgi:hypothetical protein